MLSNYNNLNDYNTTAFTFLHYSVHISIININILNHESIGLISRFEFLCLCVFRIWMLWKTLQNPSGKHFTIKQWRSKSSPNYVTAFCLGDLHPFSTTKRMHIYSSQKVSKLWQMDITFTSWNLWPNSILIFSTTIIGFCLAYFPISCFCRTIKVSWYFLIESGAIRKCNTNTFDSRFIHNWMILEEQEYKSLHSSYVLEV